MVMTRKRVNLMTESPRTNKDTYLTSDRILKTGGQIAKVS